MNFIELTHRSLGRISINVSNISTFYEDGDRTRIELIVSNGDEADFVIAEQSYDEVLRKINEVCCQELKYNLDNWDNFSIELDSLRRKRELFKKISDLIEGK